MKFWLRVAVSSSLLALLLVLVPWHEVRTAMARLPGTVWLIALACVILGHALFAAKWRLLVNAGQSKLGWVDAVRCHFAGMFANICLPGMVGGEVLRAVLAGRTTGRPEAAALGALADRLIDTSALVLLVAAGGFFIRTVIPGWGVQLFTAVLLVVAVTALVFLPLLLRRPLKQWPRRLRRPAGRGLVALRRLWQRPGIAVIGITISLVVQGGFVLLNAWIGRSIGVDAPLGAWFFAWGLAKLAGALPISLGGLGVRDATLAALLVPFGVPAAHGVVASLVWQSIVIAAGLLGGAVWWLLGRASDQPSTLRYPWHKVAIVAELPKT